MIRTLETLGTSKLQPAEQDRIREAADTLLFCEDPSREDAREALRDIEDLSLTLAESGRLTEDRARELSDDVAACGPLAPVL